MRSRDPSAFWSPVQMLLAINPSLMSACLSACPSHDLLVKLYDERDLYGHESPIQ
jgi:hypothetical protein